MFGAINGNEAFEFHAGIVAATTSENLIGRLGRAPSWVRLVRAGTEFSFHRSCRSLICSFCAKVPRRRFPQQLPIAEPDFATEIG